MEVLHGTCSGVDVHKKLLVVCLRSGRKSEIRNFGTTTQDLFEVANWLKSNNCEMVAMESTGSYWKPLYELSKISEKWPPDSSRIYKPIVRMSEINIR